MRNGKSITKKVTISYSYCPHQNDFIKFSFISLSISSRFRNGFSNPMFWCISQLPIPMSYPLSLFLSTGCRLFNPYFKAYFIINHQNVFMKSFTYGLIHIHSCFFFWNIEYKELSVSIIVKALQGFYLNCKSTVVEDF